MFSLAAVWIGVVVLVSQTSIWFIEQGMVEGSLRHDPGRWVISLVAGAAISIPFYLLSFVKDPLYQNAFRIWSVAGILMILLSPARVLSITNSQGAQTLQLAGLLLSAGVLTWWLRRKNYYTATLVHPRYYPSGNLVTGIALVLCVPWVVYGALGSWIDTVLGLAVGLLAGICVYLCLQIGWSQIRPVNGSGSILFTGYVISQVLVIFCGALGVNGNEWVLLLTVPCLSWISVRWIEKPGFCWLIGLAFANPLIWVDPDELSLIITFGKGDLMERIATASLLAFSLTLIMTALLFLKSKLVRSPSVNVQKSRLLLVIIFIALIGIYFFVGTPGFYGEKLFVVLKDQADLTAIPDSLDYPARRQLVYKTLVEHAEISQAQLRGVLRKAGIQFTPYYLVNSLEVEAGPFVRLWLNLHPAVDRVLDNPILRPIPKLHGEISLPNQPKQEQIPWNLSLVQADHVWNELGVRGEGIIIGHSDSGVEGDHPELQNQYTGRSGNNDYSWFDPWYGSQAPVDYGGHGTHTLGLILGSQVGVAPGAEWIGCVNLARNLGNMAYYLDCLQFMLAPFPQDGDPFKDGDTSKGAHVINNSWGCPAVEGCDAESMLPAFQALRKAGIFAVASAGNSGNSGCGSVDSPPAIYLEVYTVGSIDKNGERALFSSVGPVMVDGSLRSKPDILAPGEAILSAFPVNGYNTLSGTSMAGPHVAGVVALMWSANPQLVGEVDLTRNLINKTAREFTGLTLNCDYGYDQKPSNISGYGIVDAYAAVRAAMALRE